MPPEWLIDAGAWDEGKDVDRLQADGEMLLQLQLAGYAGKAWEYFSDVLARYGYAVLRGWLLRGVLLDKCREKRIKGLPQRGLGRIDAQAAEELAGETVAVAIVAFRSKVLMRNRWDPRGGASLRTFFIGQCLVRFPDVYRRWHGEEYGWKAEAADPTVLESPARDDPAMTAVRRVEVEHGLRDLDKRTAQVLRLVAEDLPQEDIARRMTLLTGQPMTAKAVETLIYRHRQRQLRKGA